MQRIKSGILTRARWLARRKSAKRKAAGQLTSSLSLAVENWSSKTTCFPWDFPSAAHHLRLSRLQMIKRISADRARGPPSIVLTVLDLPVRDLLYQADFVERKATLVDIAESIRLSQTVLNYYNESLWPSSWCPSKGQNVNCGSRRLSIRWSWALSKLSVGGELGQKSEFQALQQWSKLNLKTRKIDEVLMTKLH